MASKPPTLSDKIQTKTIQMQVKFLKRNRSVIFVAVLFIAVSFFFRGDSVNVLAQSGNESVLVRTREADRKGRTNDGKLETLTPTEHLRRAAIYMSNRAFAEAREHYQAIFDRYPNDAAVGPALFFTGRSYFQSHRYQEALPYYERVSREFKDTIDGREGLSQWGTALLRMGKFNEAVERYKEYVSLYPNGEKIEAVHLNIIDTLREGGRLKDAIAWIEIARQKFPNTATATNAVFARLRLDITQKDWTQAVKTAEQLRTMPMPAKTMTDRKEIDFLRGYALEKSGRKTEAIEVYFSIPDGLGTYHGGLATERLLAIVDETRLPQVAERINRVKTEALRSIGQYPAPYRDELLRATTKRKIDPRLVLSLMKQESSFRAHVKSPAAARGLLQLTIDTASKYSAQAGYKNLRDDDLYRPETSITIGSEYIAALQKLFPNTPEAVAASYNGGEDNAARWLKRAKSDEPFIFTAEVGFDETKDYVFKVMSNYRAYRLLYSADLKRI